MTHILEKFAEIAQYLSKLDHPDQIDGADQNETTKGQLQTPFNPDIEDDFIKITFKSTRGMDILIKNLSEITGSYATGNKPHKIIFKKPHTIIIVNYLTDVNDNWPFYELRFSFRIDMSKLKGALVGLEVPLNEEEELNDNDIEDRLEKIFTINSEIILDHIIKKDYRKIAGRVRDPKTFECSQKFGL